MKALFFCVFLTVFLVVASDVTVSPCNQVCSRGPSHVNQCCQAYKFLGGYCDSNNVAWCKEAPGQERSPNARSVHKPPCDETCTNGGYVRECCRAHGLKGGVCDQGRAYCDLPDDESQGSSTYVPTAPRFQNNTTLAWFNPNALGPPETVEMESSLRTWLEGISTLGSTKNEISYSFNWNSALCWGFLVHAEMHVMQCDPEYVNGGQAVKLCCKRFQHDTGRCDTGNRALCRRKDTTQRVPIQCSSNPPSTGGNSTGRVPCTPSSSISNSR